MLVPTSHDPQIEGFVIPRYVSLLEMVRQPTVHIVKNARSQPGFSRQREAFPVLLLNIQTKDRNQPHITKHQIIVITICSDKRSPHTACFKAFLFFDYWRRSTPFDILMSIVVSNDETTFMRICPERIHIRDAVI